MSNIYTDFSKLHSEMTSINEILIAISDGKINDGLARVKKAYELRLAEFERMLEHEKNLQNSVFHVGSPNYITKLEADIVRLQQIVLTLNSLG